MKVQAIQNRSLFVPARPVRRASFGMTIEPGIVLSKPTRHTKEAQLRNLKLTSTALVNRFLLALLLTANTII